MDSTLPPEIPLTARDLQDPRLQPIIEEPPMFVGDDFWEVIIDKNTYGQFENMADMFEWMQIHRDDFNGQAKLNRFRRGDFI